MWYIPYIYIPYIPDWWRKGENGWGRKLMRVQWRMNGVCSNVYSRVRAAWACTIHWNAMLLPMHYAGKRFLTIHET